MKVLILKGCEAAENAISHKIRRVATFFDAAAAKGQ